MSLAITITPATVNKVREILAEPDNANVSALRIYVQGGGCGGFQYGFSLETEAGEDDFVIELDGVKFLVDCMSSSYLEGAEIDYVTSAFDSHFSITNPNAKTTCGCGSSFSA